MRTVWKFSIPHYSETVATFEVPMQAGLLYVAAENRLQADEQTSLWFEVDTEAETESRTFEVFGTGHEIPDTAGAYVGTAVAPPLVLHVYERTIQQTRSE